MNTLLKVLEKSLENDNEITEKANPMPSQIFMQYRSNTKFCRAEHEIRHVDRIEKP